MARQIIDTTTPQPGGKMGDTAKVAFEKVNDNFAELYDATDSVKQFKDEQTNLYTTEEDTATVTNAEGVPVEVPSWKKVSEANINADAALAAVGAMQSELDSLSDDVDAIRDGQAAGQKVYRTWSELSGVTGSAGEGAQVIDDTGTHTDPVVGGTVANAGQYVWSDSPAGWRWVRPDALPLKADKTDIQQLAPPLDVDSVERIPLFVDAAGSVPLWLEGGGVAFSEVGPSGRQAISNFAMLGYATKALLDADLSPADGALALVTNDTTLANNGTYRKSGASGTGSWVQSADRVSALEAAVQMKVDQAALDQLRDDVAPSVAVDTVESVPLMVDAAGSVPLWLENGGIAFSGVGPSGQKAIADFLAPLGGIPDPIDLDNDYVPLFRDSSGNVPLWLENGGIGASGFGPSFVARLRSHVQSRQYGYAYSTPVATDGRTLYRYRSKLARKAVGEAVKPRIMLMGDSWMDLPALPQGIANHLYAMHGRGGEGWITNGESNYMNGITRTNVGVWTLYDASTGAAPLYGTGLNGQSLSTTANDARTLIRDVLCTDFTIYYQDLDGTFQYGVYDGDSVATWETVVCGGTGITQSVTISGLADGQHTFEVRTNGNTGRVVIHGFEANRAGTPGIIIDKAGNSGATSSNLMDYLPYVPQYLTELQPDVIVLALGTNDSSVEFDTGKFRAHLPAMIDAWRGALPDVGIVLIVPSRVNGVKRSALVDYRDAIYEIAMSMGTEFYSLYDDWSDSATMHALNMFDDDVHPNNAGSAFIARRLASLMEL